MKTTLTTLLLILGTAVFAQSKEEENLLKLSAKIFTWEVLSKFDSLGNSLADRLVVLNSVGGTQTKADYLARLESGNFVHNKITTENNIAVISGNTGAVIGKGIFDITADGKQSVVYLTFLELFIRSSSGTPWTLLALHASVIPHTR